MNKTGILNLGDRAITGALAEQVITSSQDANGVSGQAFIDGLEDMGSVTLWAEFVYGSGGTSCIAIVDTSLDQGESWIEIARFDFAQANRVAIATVSAGPYPVTTLAALAANAKRDGVLGDRLRARVTSDGTYATNTSLSVRMIARSAAAGKDASDTLAPYLDGIEALLASLNTYVDGLEAGQTGIASALTVIQGYIDTLETLVAAVTAAVNSTQTVRVDQTLYAATAVIANGESLSGAVDCSAGRLGRIVIPATWTAANLTFQGSYDGSNYANLYDEAGTEYTVTVGGAAREIKVPVVDFLSVRYLKIRSGTSGTPVNQGGARTLNLVLVP